MAAGVELLLYFLGFYLAQRIRFVPENSRIYIRSGPWRAAHEGGGFRLAGLWPGTRCVVGSRLPFRMTRESARFETALERFGSRGGSPARWISLGQVMLMSAEGPLVWAGNTRLVRTASNAEARRLRSLLGALAGASLDDRLDRAERGIARSLSVTELEQRMEDVSRATGFLSVCSGIYLIAVIGVAVVSTAWLLSGLFLWWCLAGLVGVHAVTVFALWRAHRRLFPAERGERVEVVLGGALFPPALIAAEGKLWVEGVGGFHPAAVAAVMLSEERFRRRLRRELAAAVYGLPPGEARVDPGPPFGSFLVRSNGHPTAEENLLAVPTRGELSRFAEGYGLSVEDAVSHGSLDPDALRYCPVCLAGFQEHVAECEACGVRTRPQPTRPAAGRVGK